MIEQALIKTLGFGSKEFIERAVKGGWKYDDYCDGFGCKDRHIFLDPAAWKAVERDTIFAMDGWEKFAPRKIEEIVANEAKNNMLRFVRELCALAEEESSKA